jgi:uncharacterized protein YndB with AHSA1/START domain
MAGADLARRIDNPDVLGRTFMSLQKDPSGRRYVQAEVIVPGTPEEVWQAIATGEGVSSWFVPTEKREDGTVVSKFGPGPGMEAVARETAYDPPRRFVGEGDICPGGPTMATEWTVEALSGGTCRVRVVHSLFASTDDWDNQLEAIEEGWPEYFENLKLYLNHFRGKKSSTIQFLGMAAGSVDEAWKTVAGAFGLQGATAGSRMTTSEEVPPLIGVVERIGPGGHEQGTLVRITQPGPGMAHVFAHPMGGAVFVVLRLYLFGDRAQEAAKRNEPLWQAWFNSRFPFGAPPENCG